MVCLAPDSDGQAHQPASSKRTTPTLASFGYETGNLGGAFDRLVKAVPLYQGVATKDMLLAFVASPLNALASAVQSQG